MMPPAAAPRSPPVAAPRWVLGPAGAAQLERAIAARALVMAVRVVFINMRGWRRIGLNAGRFKYFSWGAAHRARRSRGFWIGWAHGSRSFHSCPVIPRDQPAV